jgi:hypothetical protein
VSSEPESEANFSWRTLFADSPLVHVAGLKFTSMLSPLSLISAHGGVANAGAGKCSMALRVVGRELG